jgi:hypothetical protein
MMTFHHLMRYPLVEILGGVWCMLNGPIAYLSFNSELRRDFFQIFLGANKMAKKLITTMIPQIRRKKMNTVYNMDIVIPKDVVQFSPQIK